MVSMAFMHPSPSLSSLGAGVPVGVGLNMGVAVGVRVSVGVGVIDGVGVTEGVTVEVRVGVRVLVGVGVLVCVGVLVTVGTPAPQVTVAGWFSVVGLALPNFSSVAVPFGSPSRATKPTFDTPLAMHFIVNRCTTCVALEPGLPKPATHPALRAPCPAPPPDGAHSGPVHWGGGIRVSLTKSITNGSHVTLDWKP
jgi:hypothetical protein